MLTSTATPVMLWELSDAEAVHLGTAIGAFAKYAPITEQQSAIGIDISLLIEAIVSVTQQRLVIEGMFLAQQREQAEAAAADQEHRQHPNGAPNGMDRRAGLYAS